MHKAAPVKYGFPSLLWTNLLPCTESLISVQSNTFGMNGTPITRHTLSANIGGQPNWCWEQIPAAKSLKSQGHEAVGVAD